MKPESLLVLTEVGPVVLPSTTAACPDGFILIAKETYGNLVRKARGKKPAKRPRPVPLPQDLPASLKKPRERTDIDKAVGFAYRAFQPLHIALHAVIKRYARLARLDPNCAPALLLLDRTYPNYAQRMAEARKLVLHLTAQNYDLIELLKGL